MADDPQTPQPGLDAGADDFLTKPVNDLALITGVRSLSRLKMVIDELRMRAIAPAGAPPEPVVSATPGALTVDYGVAREFGGMVLHWADGLHAARYDVAFSDDGSNWRTVRKVRDSSGSMASQMRCATMLEKVAHDSSRMERPTTS